MINYEEELKRMAQLVMELLINCPEIDNLQTELLCRHLCKLGYIEMNPETNEWVIEIKE